MSQFDFGTMDPATKTGSVLASDLNSFRDALNSLHTGTSRPSYAVAGTQWINNAATPWLLCVYTGTVDITLGTVDTVNSVFRIDSSGLPTYTTTGAVNVLVVASTPTITAYKLGQSFIITPNLDTTGAVTVNVDAAGAKAIKNQDGSALSSGTLLTTGMYTIVYNGTYFILANSPEYSVNADASPVLGGSLDCNIYQVQESKGADIASALALPVLTDGNYFDVTGTTNITSIGTTGKVGTEITLHFDAILTIVHHATNLILPTSASIITQAGDHAIFREYASGLYRCISYTRDDGTSLAAAAPATSAPPTVQVFTTSGTWTRPTDMVSCEVFCTSAGGGGTHSSTNVGGAAGATAIKMFTAAEIGSSQTITIGAAGPGSVSTPGTTASPTSVGLLLNCTGGSGGSASTSIGGVATGGDININGGNGGIGNGGGSYYGSGDTMISGTHGGTSTVYGTGGTPGFSGNGGTGGAGIVRIVEYYEQ